MWENIKSIIYRLFNKNIDISDDDAQAKASYDSEYADTSTINITAIIANKLATLTVDDSDITVSGNNKLPINPNRQITVASGNKI